MLEWKPNVQIMFPFFLATAQVKDRMDILSRQSWQCCLLLVRAVCIDPASSSKYNVAINSLRM